MSADHNDESAENQVVDYKYSSVITDKVEQLHVGQVHQIIIHIHQNTEKKQEKSNNQ